MPVTIDSLRLWGADESTAAAEGQVEVTSIPVDGEEALITSLTRAESNTLSGRVTGIRLTTESGYPSDPADAVAQWLQELESLVGPEQGDGWTLQDDERDRSTTVTATQATWTRQAGAPLEARWTLEVQVGEGVADSGTRSPTTATVGSTTTLDGTGLGTVLEKRIERSIEIETSPIAFAPASEQVIIPQSGALTRFTLTGRKAGTTATLRSFHNTMRQLVGGDQQVTYQSAYPSTSHDVLVGNYDDTWQAGVTGSIEYTMTLHEGVVLSPA